jgi:predicted RNA-binding Zn ribbon-like protein
MSDSHDFSFDGGALCLDFANTFGDRPISVEENLKGIEDLFAWGTAAGLVSDDEIDRVRRRVKEPEVVFGDAIELREAIYAICTSLAAKRVPSRRDLKILNSVLRTALPNLELGIRGGGCCWEWADASTVSDRILWPVARSAADLLTSAASAQIRECAGDGCSWLFLDTSRNHRRKWCSMSSCGNRAKARRHYARKQSKTR